MGVIDEVKQRIDIVEIVGQYATLTKAGRTFRALCPFHSEKHASFFVYPEQQSWHCFGACNTGGDVLSFIMKKQGIDFGDALRLLAQRAGVVIPSRFEPEAGGEEKQRLYQINQAAAQYFHNLLLNSPEGGGTRNYLDSRGFSAKTIADFQLGFSLNSWEALKEYLMERGYTDGELLTAGLVVEAEGGKSHDRFRNRLMFPIFDAQGRIAGFGARVLDDSLPKYVNSPQTPIFDKSGILYGIDKAKSAIRQQEMAVIVEGYMDVITAHQSGFDNVVASMGTSVTEKQVNILKKLTRNMALALDADAAGEEAMLRGIAHENTLGTEVKVILMPEGKDPDDVIKEDTQAWQKLLEEALPVVDYTFNMVTADLDLTTAKGKILVRDKLKPIIKEIKDVVRKAHYLQKLARLIDVSERTLEADFAEPKLSRAKFQAKDSEPGTTTRTMKPSNPEEYCLALLLKYPELKNSSPDILPEYFQNSESREIFNAWQKDDDLSSLKEGLDATIHEYLDHILTKSLLHTRIQEKYSICASRLQEEYYKNLERKRQAQFALEVEEKGTGADLARLKEEGIEPSIRLREIFHSKKPGASGIKGVRNELEKQK